MKALLALFGVCLLLSPLPLPAEIAKEKPGTSQPIAVAGEPGSSFAKAVPAASIEAEYQWLAKHYPGYRMRRQSLRMHERKPFDVLAITTKDGRDLEVYFDISSFFGK